MSLTDEDLAPLFLPGTIPLPSPHPAVGDVELEEVHEPGPLVVVRRRVWPSTRVSWAILADRVSAILVTKSNNSVHDTWLFGSSVPERLKSLAHGKAVKGIVFVPEDAPVLMRIEFGKTASECADYPIPGLMGGGCDPCVTGAFSYESVMLKPDK